MLFVLTGDVQTGKTRWLERVTSDLEEAGVVPRGVIAPGVWADRRDDPNASEHVDENGFEKLGIENVLLPNKERITFAQRADLASRDENADPRNQSARAKLHWRISEDAIERVNAHFAHLSRERDDEKKSGFLIVDELGQLELIHGGGLTEAVSLLDAGPSPSMAHALIVVRAALLPHLEGRFERWGEQRLVKPDEASREAIIAAARTSR